MVTEDTFKITGEICAKTNPLFSYSSKILRDWITSIYCKVCPNVLWFFLPFPLYKKILINKPGSQFSTINKFYVQATVAFMSVRCKSKFTSYVKHYTRREKQGRFLVLKDICVSIKSASCVLNTAGWSYSDQMAFLSQPGDLSGSTVFQSCICFRELWGNAGQAPALLPVLWELRFSCCLGCGAAWVVPGTQRLWDGKNWAQTGAVLPQQRARQPGGVWSPEGNEKSRKRPRCAN